jgi:hypothetical protein
MAKAAKKTSKYSAHPGLAKEAADKERLREATGKTFDQWVELARAKGPKEHAALRTWLREKHGHGSMVSWWLAQSAIATAEEDYSNPEGFVDELYSGAKAAWRPLHEKAVDAALACGGDVIATSCKTMVPIYRKHVFMELRPVADGVDVQLALGEKPKDRRFEEITNGMPGGRLTHRIVLTSPADLDAGFADALKTAYENGAGKMKRAESAKCPADLSKALKGASKATATWDTCTPAMQRDWILWIESAKQQQTRERRVERAITLLSAGKRKNY